MDAVPDELLRTFSSDGSAMVRVLSATRLVREAVTRHQTGPTASVALGRALMGGVLLASRGQDGERLQLRLRGDGPLGNLTVTAESDGRVRGFVQHPRADVPFRGGELGISDALGPGTLAVERNHARWKHPYSGIVPREGEIAQDLARYLLESEQKPSAVALGVYLSAGGEVEAAGGFLVQGLPGSDDRILAELETRIAQTPPAELLRGGARPEDILGELLGELPHGSVDRVAPRFACPCSRERAQRASLLLGREDLREAVGREEELEVRCAFCAEVYRLAPDALAALLPDA